MSFSNIDKLTFSQARGVAEGLAREVTKQQAMRELAGAITALGHNRSRWPNKRRLQNIAIIELKRLRDKIANN